MPRSSRQRHERLPMITRRSPSDETVYLAISRLLPAISNAKIGGFDSSSSLCYVVTKNSKKVPVFLLNSVRRRGIVSS